MPSETIRYKGVTFRRYPESKNWAERAYFTPSGNKRKKGTGRLHQEIWKDTHGDIPEGCEIHHKDGDSLNNDIANLECKKIDQHQSVRHKGHTGGDKAHLANIRPLAAEWHRSPEGREWHKKQGRSSWKNRKPLEKICDQCGEKFETLGRKETDRFCSNACKSAWRRAAGLDDEERICAACGEAFVTNRYSKARCCSRKCAWQIRQQK